MPDDMDELIRHRMDRAEIAWKDASLLIDDGSLESVVNRLYYAAFHCVSALLLTKDLSSSKHSGVRSLFNRHFVASGEVSKTTGQTFNDLFLRRQSADYADFIQFRAADVKRWIQDCRALLDDLGTVLEKRLGDRDPS